MGCTDLFFHVETTGQGLSFWDETRHQFVPIQRPFTLLIGASSEDIRKEIVVEK